MDERGLVERARGGDHDAFTVLARDAGTRLDRAARLILRDPWSWSPDSSKILMMPEDGSTASAYLIDPESGEYTTVGWESGSSLDWQRLAP